MFRIPKTPSRTDSDDISEISHGEGTISTAGTGNTDPLPKVFREAHELRLNLIYSGCMFFGMFFLCLDYFFDFLYYPAITFLVLHCLLELRHDVVHKTRYFAHARYTQATTNDRSYGADLYLANLAQSLFVFLGISLYLLSIRLRVEGYDFDIYKAIYFASSLFIFLSGATTMLNRGCGSFYFLGRSPGFSLRDQAANFLYVTSSVIFLVIASWQVDRGVFDLPLKIGEESVEFLWLMAALHYSAADITRLTRVNPGNEKGVSDAMRLSAVESEEETNYVEMKETQNRNLHMSKSQSEPLPSRPNPMLNIPLTRSMSPPKSSSFNRTRSTTHQGSPRQGFFDRSKLLSQREIGELRRSLSGISDPSSTSPPISLNSYHSGSDRARLKSRSNSNSPQRKKPSRSQSHSVRTDTSNSAPSQYVHRTPSYQEKVDYIRTATSHSAPSPTITIPQNRSMTSSPSTLPSVSESQTRNNGNVSSISENRARNSKAPSVSESQARNGYASSVAESESRYGKRKRWFTGFRRGADPYCGMEPPNCNSSIDGVGSCMPISMDRACGPDQLARVSDWNGSPRRQRIKWNNLNPIVLDPAGGPAVIIPGRDTDTVASPISSPIASPVAPKSNFDQRTTSWNWVGDQMSSMMRGVFNQPQQALPEPITLPTLEPEPPTESSPKPAVVTPEVTPEKKSPEMAFNRVRSAEKNLSNKKSPSLKKKRSASNKTKFWKAAGADIV